MENTFFKFCEDLYIKNNQGILILNNRSNGGWIKISQECFNIINEAINTKKSKEDVLNGCFDEEDRNYMKLLFSNLYKLGIVENINSKIERKEFSLNEANLAITSKCNLKCTHCCLDLPENEKTIDPLYDDLIKAIDQIIKCNPKYIIITGGEPLLRKDIWDLVQYIKNTGNYKLELMTNGTLITEENAKLINNFFESVSISIDGYDDESCERIRGKGVFEKVISNVKILKNYKNLKISLSCISTIDNNKNYDKFKKLCDDLKVDCLFRRLAPAGRAGRNFMELNGNMTTQCNEQYIKEVNECELQMPTDSSISSGLFTTICDAFKTSITIGSDLCFYPCAALYMPEFKGINITKIDSLKEYLTKKQYMESNAFKLFRSICFDQTEPCKNCKINFICNSCPLYVYLYKKYGLLEQYCHDQLLKGDLNIWD